MHAAGYKNYSSNYYGNDNDDNYHYYHSKHYYNDYDNNYNNHNFNYDDDYCTATKV